MRSPRTATKSGPHSPQLEKAHAQQWRSNAVKNKQINLKNKQTNKKDIRIGQEFEDETGVGGGEGWREEGWATGEEARAQAVETAQGLMETELFKTKLQVVSTTGLYCKSYLWKPSNLWVEITGSLSPLLGWYSPRQGDHEQKMRARGNLEWRNAPCTPCPVPPLGFYRNPGEGFRLSTCLWKDEIFSGS